MCRAVCADLLVPVDMNVADTAIAVDAVDEHPVEAAQFSDAGGASLKPVCLCVVSLSGHSCPNVVDTGDEERAGMCGVHLDPLYGVLLMIICGPGLLWLGRGLWFFFEL